VLGFGLSVIWCLQVGYRAGMAGVLTLFWMRNGWAGLRV